MSTPNISVVGTGYVGLSTAVGFASKDYKVITSNRDNEKASKTNESARVTVATLYMA